MIVKGEIKAIIQVFQRVFDYHGHYTGKLSGIVNKNVKQKINGITP